MIKEPINDFPEKIYNILNDCDSLFEKEQKIENLISFRNLIGLKYYKLKYRIWNFFTKN